jgi:hypothetical protein
VSDEQEPSCGHQRVDRITKYDDQDVPEDHWYCSACHVEFVPRPQVPVDVCEEQLMREIYKGLLPHCNSDELAWWLAVFHVKTELRMKKLEEPSS